MSMPLRPLLFAAALAFASSQAAAPAASYVVDPARSWIKFMFTQAKAENYGKFRAFNVALRFDDKNLAASRLEVTVKVDSLDTGDGERDAALRGADLFDVAKFPEAKFRSTSFSRVAAGRFEVSGKLTIRGVTRNVVVPMALYTGQEKTGTVAYMNGGVAINRLDYGVGQGEFKATDEVANEVIVKFGMRLPAAATAAPAPAPAAAPAPKAPAPKAPASK